MAQSSGNVKVAIWVMTIVLAASLSWGGSCVVNTAKTLAGTTERTSVLETRIEYQTKQLDRIERKLDAVLLAPQIQPR